MSGVDWKFQVNVHEQGTTAPSVDNVYTTVEYTFATDDLTSLFSYGGIEVEPLRGDVRTFGARCTLLDTNEQVTAALADAGGRMVWLGRLLDVRISKDGGTNYTTEAIYRITATRESGPGAYILDLQDEHLNLRQSFIFKEVGSVLGSGAAADYPITRILPPGIEGQYRSFTYGTVRPSEPVSVSGDWVLVPLDRILLPNPGNFFDALPMEAIVKAWPELVELIKEDAREDYSVTLTGSTGNFNTLRCRVNGTDREIKGFVFDIQAGGFSPYPGWTLDQILAGKAESLNTPVWVYWPTFASDPISSAFLHMPSAEPTEKMRKLIGGPNGIRVGQILKDIFDETATRHDSAATQAIIDDASYGTINMRAPAPANAWDWLRENICQPYLIALLNDRQGRIKPTPLKQPQNLSIGSLFEFNVSNATQPTWEHLTQEQVTRLIYTYTHETMLAFTPSDVASLGEAFRDYGYDFLHETEQTITREHDRITEFGIQEMEIGLRGLHERFRRVVLQTGIFSIPWAAEVRSKQSAREFFERFGDGAILYKLRSDPTNATAPVVGDFVILDFANLPNPATQSRGGDRIAQVMSRQVVLEPGDPGTWAYEYRLLDAGPNAQPLTAPSVSSAQTSGDEHHAIDVTISSLPAGAGYTLQVAQSATEPAASSSLWTTVRLGSANETVTIRPLASGTKFYFRVKATAQGRIESAWSTTSNTTTAALSAPTTLTDNGTDGASTELRWVNTETDYEIEVLLDAAACAGASPERIDSLPPGSDRYVVRGMEISTTHCARVRYRDPWGGLSATAQREFTTTGTAPTLQAPLAIAVLG